MRDTTRKIMQGTVVSTAMDKTITVRIDTYRPHKLYGKRVLSSSKIKAHDANEVAKVGDVVTIQSTRPISKTVSFRLLEVKEAK